MRRTHPGHNPDFMYKRTTHPDPDFLDKRGNNADPDPDFIVKIMDMCLCLENWWK